ncbi:MAG: hypothetical protein KJZ80_01560 [Hyphomicrobiaceae bacterium]|nr:hypothetical protein [Hyphomicrobiaceae bacterium]
MAASWRDTALVIAAHGERRPVASNRSLLQHVATLEGRADFAGVWAGVLHGEPAIEQALASAEASGATTLLVYPFLMSDGVILRETLKNRMAACRPKQSPCLLPPLGLEPRLIVLLSGQAVSAAREAGFDPSRTRLLVAGHGSRLGGESAWATRRAAGLLEGAGLFASVDVAFLGEPPLIADRLAVDRGPVVVLGFFSGDGMHARCDVPAAIDATGAHAVYTGPIGACPGIADIIMTTLEESRSEIRSPRSSRRSSRHR